ENHGGRTALGPAATPFGAVRAGVGNGAASDVASVDGAVQGSVVATYLHGPVLARNPRLADALLTRVVGGPLAPVDDAEVEELHRERVTAAGRARRRAPWRRQWKPPARY